MSNACSTVSIITVALNEAARLARLKESLDRMLVPPGFRVETILVDGGSGDDTVEVGRKDGFDYIVECRGANIPFCRNVGAHHAGGEWLAYVDADCELPSDWLLHAARWMTRGKVRLMGWPARPPRGSPWLPTAWHLHWTTKNLRWAEVDGERVVEHQAFRLITTRCLVIERTLFDELAGFDERLDTGEDTDLARRADAGGHLVLGIPELEAVHRGEPETLREFFRQQLWHANRRSYTPALRDGRGYRALVFTVIFLVCSLVGLASVIAAVTRPSVRFLAGLAPLGVLVLGPAIVTAARARRLRFAGPLALLYFLYGTARSIDLLGLARNKKNWKQEDT